MPGQVRPVADERDGLLAFLAQQRSVLRLTAFGLSDAQARQSIEIGGLSVGGLIKHCATVEQAWMDNVEQVQTDASPEDYADNFTMRDDESLTDLYALSDEAAARTEAIVEGIADLGAPVPVPKDVPWFPKDVDAWSVRWVLLHLITETARHAGHADIVREHIDGATAFPLMAAAENWPESPWMQPWTPSAS